ncbi:uncharacterized protein LOC117305824 isoform X2 [Asterias rubens]|uniref:uncharacterized protein LOC117305824 isoform X2 n=1 Tax=Asterias rubens TaxID=7604 RepID=UPI0014555336|nr:uncharacterized protein LOC117305824 isoform X2 [Asterias rubens]
MEKLPCCLQRSAGSMRSSFSIKDPVLSLKNEMMRKLFSEILTELRMLPAGTVVMNGLNMYRIETIDFEMTFPQPWEAYNQCSGGCVPTTSFLDPPAKATSIQVMNLRDDNHPILRL